jgi:LysR family cys regulon transcriptional activator
MVRVEQIDFAVATGSQDQFGRLLLLPCYQWHQRIVVPRGHPLTQVARPSLEQLAAFPLITYVFSIAEPASLYETFANAHLHADVALTAQDADVIKTYVRLGLGVGIIADVALEPRDAEDLDSIDAAHLFPVQTTWVGFPRGALLRGYMYEFLQLLAPHLTRKLVERVERCGTQQEVDELFEKIAISARPSPDGLYPAHDVRETRTSSPHNRAVTQR